MTGYDSSRSLQPEFREVFRNGYVTGFSIRPLLGTIFCFIFGLIFSAFLLWVIVYYGLVLLDKLTGFDPLNLRQVIGDQSSPEDTLIERLVGGFIWLLIIAFLGPQNLLRVKRRLASRLYVLSGRPLASVVGKPVFDPDSDSDYGGVEVGDFYFNFTTDCWLNAAEDDLDRLQQADGELRVWYIPKGLRTWKKPQTNKWVTHNAVLVRAEWRPHS